MFKFLFRGHINPHPDILIDVYELQFGESLTYVTGRVLCPKVHLILVLGLLASMSGVLQ